MKSINRGMNRNDRARKDRWSSVDNVVDQAVDEIANEQRELETWYRTCRRYNPDTFGQMSLEAFKRWNDRRLAEIDAAAEADENQPERSGTLKMANKLLLILLQELGGVPEKTLEILVALKNQLVEDYENAPSDTASREIYAALKEQAALTGLREEGRVSPDALQMQQVIQEQCQKQKLVPNDWGKAGQ